MAEKSMCLLGNPIIILYIFHCLGSNNILLVPSDIFTRNAWISMYKFLYDTDQSPHKALAKCRILKQNTKTFVLLQSSVKLTLYPQQGARADAQGMFLPVECFFS